MTPKEKGVTVQSIDKTRNESVPIKIGKGATDKSEFNEALKTALGDAATVKDMEPRASLEIRDINVGGTEYFVKEVLIKVINAKTTITKVKLSPENSRGQKLAKIVVDQET